MRSSGLPAMLAGFPTFLTISFSLSCVMYIWRDVMAFCKWLWISRSLSASACSGVEMPDMFLQKWHGRIALVALWLAEACERDGRGACPKAMLVWRHLVLACLLVAAGMASALRSEPGEGSAGGSFLSGT